MGIGTSMGAYYDDAFHQSAAQWDNKYDENVLDPDINDQTSSDVNTIDPSIKTEDFITEVGSSMPFPNNNNPDTNFDSRFPKDMKSGILNDLKPQQDKPLVRKISDKLTGKYLGDLGADEDISYDHSVPIGRREGDKIIRHSDPAEIMKNLPPDQEGFTLPDNPILWIRKQREPALTS